MDIVYTVSPSQVHDHTELRYSIRSLVKHLHCIDKIFIVGHKPEFLANTIHIPAENIKVFDPAFNIYQKVLAACLHSKLSSHFLYCSDDHFLLRDVRALEFPYYYSGNLEMAIARSTDAQSYKPHLLATLDVLTQRSLPTQHFNVHSPIVYRKDIFISLMREYDWTGKKGYVLKSLYANTLRIPGVEHVDVKIHNPKTKSAIYRKIKGHAFFSTDERALNPEMHEVLEELYPEQSPWEK